MGPKRKKSKPNTDEQGYQQSSQDEQPDQSLPTTQQQQQQPAPSSVDTSLASSQKPVPQARPSTWYGGSWRSKASPVAQIAQETISSHKGATSEASEEASRRPGQSVSKSMRGSRKSVPLVAEATRVHVTSDAERDKSRPAFPPEEKLKGVEEEEEPKSEPKVVVEEAPLPPQPPVPSADNDDTQSVDSTAKPAPSAWFGWWSRPDGYGSDGEMLKEGAKRQKLDAETATNTPLPGSPEVAPADANKDLAKADVATTVTEEPTAKAGATAAQWEGLQPEMSMNNTPSRSWFGLWSSAQYQQAQNDVAKAQEAPPQAAPDVTAPTEPASVERAAKKDEPVPAKSDVKRKMTEERPRTAGWAFWSSDRPQEETKMTSGTETQVGELAVADTPSQSHPEAAQFNEQRDDRKKAKSEVKRTGSLLKRARGEKSKEATSNTSAVTLNPSQVNLPQQKILADTPLREDTEIPTPVQRGKQPQTRPNLILPAFRDTYPTQPNPGYLERLSQYLAHTLRLPGAQPPLLPVHVNRSLSPPRVKRAIAIGIHGFFPAPLIQKVLGQPTGTSIRFANYAASSIKSWCDEFQSDVRDVEIEKVALEGEGYITDRVATLWKLLLNWLSHLRQADFVLVACHSQGVPVATMLVAKLIQLGCLSPHVRLGICAMAGINLGPFPEYKSRLFGGTALELFEFADPASKVSKAYAESLELCLRHGVRITFVGSLDDQLVSLESSLFAPLSHPYVSRAVFIDGRLHAPNFLTHLVVFALKLRNLGISDHGLIRELSGPLAGSLVGGEGHSRVYDDPAVYSLAVEFALQSTDTTLLGPNHMSASTQSAAEKLLASDKARAHDKATLRRASLSGYPSTPAMANRVRRGSLSASTSLPGIAPVIAHYEALPSTSTPANPFYLPWAVRGMLEEDIVKRDAGMWAEVAVLVKEFEEWRPTSKVLKDVRWRLEGVRSML